MQIEPNHDILFYKALTGGQRILFKQMIKLLDISE